eukprot:193354_1
MSDAAMDDLINLINDTTLSPSKKPPTKTMPIPPNPMHDLSDTNSDDEDLSYLLDAMHNPPSSTVNHINFIKPNPPSNHIKHPLSSPQTDNPFMITNSDTPHNASVSSLDDLVSLLSPTQPTHKPPTDTAHKPIRPTAQIKPIQPTAQTKTPSPPPPPRDTIDLSIRTLTGETMHYQMKRNDTVKSVKLNIFKDHKIWPQHQRLVYGGESLMDKHKLSTLGIQNEAILYIVLTTICSNKEPPKRIKIQKLNGHTFDISCTSSDTVQALKRTICNQEGYEMESQILHFTKHGRLENHKTLSEYNIQNNSMIMLMVRNTRFDNLKDEDDEEQQEAEEDEEQVILQPFSPQNDPKQPPKDSNQPVAPPIDPKQPVITEQKDVNPPVVPPIVPTHPPVMPPKNAPVIGHKPPVVPMSVPSNVNTIPNAPPRELKPHIIDPNQPMIPTGAPEQAKPHIMGPTEPKAPMAVPPNIHAHPPMMPSGPTHPLKPAHPAHNIQTPSLPDLPPEAKATVSGAPNIPPLPPNRMAIQKQSYKGWSVGDICYRKNQKCVIQMIDFKANPPSLIVSVFTDPKRQISTEFDLISKAPAPPPAPSLHTKRKSNSSSTSSLISPRRKALNKRKIHLCSPNIIRQLMAVNNIKYVGGGLKNLGNSCFMNATLQCLTYTQVFQNYIYQNIHGRMCKSKVCFMCELHSLLPQIINNGGRVCVPSRLFNSLQYLSASLVPGRQEDSHELWTALVKHLQSAVIKPHMAANGGKKLPIAIQETSVIYKIWGGYLRSQILCTVCNKGSNTYDSILDLSLEIRGCSNVIGALRKFTVQEKLFGDNKYFCSFCNTKQNAIKQLSIFDAPNILILHLKRFEFGTKIDKFVQFDTSLDLTPFMSQAGKMKQKGVKITYSLYAVLIHAGKYSNCGHYYSYVRTANNKWYLCNDSSVRSSTRQNVLKQNGYMFFYQRNQSKRYL